MPSHRPERQSNVWSGYVVVTLPDYPVDSVGPVTNSVTKSGDTWGHRGCPRAMAQDPKEAEKPMDTGIFQKKRAPWGAPKTVF